MVKQSAKLDEAFGALADPTRRAIVERLTRGEATVTDLARPFEMSLPAVLKHLTVLREAGLVVTAKEGRVRRCRLDERGLARAESWIERRRAIWNQRMDALEAHLKEER